MSQAIKVGIFVTICLLVLGFLVFSIEDWRLFGDEGRELLVLFDSVAGLNPKAAVRIAGVRVGQVEEIRLRGRQAEVQLRLEQPVVLTAGSRAVISNSGILGDKFIEIVPGPIGAPTLAADATLDGETPVSFDQALERFDSLGQALQELTGDVSARGDVGQSIRRLLDNLEATSSDIRDLVAANRSQIDSTVGNLDRFSATLAEELPVLAREIGAVVDSIDRVIASNEGNLGESMDNVRQLTDELQTSVDNLNEISTQLRSGEGTLGKLLFSDEAHSSLVDTLGAVEGGVTTLTDTIGRIGKIELELGLEGAVYADNDDSLAAFDLRFNSHPRRFYRAALVDSPQGDETTEVRTITTTFPDGSTETRIVEEITVEDKYTISAQVGYSLFDNFDVRAGLIESAGGGAVDLRLLDKKVLVTLEAFDFSRPDDLEPHLRLSTRFHLSPNIYLLGGYDDFLADDQESVFFGAGVRWKDDDLKYLLGSIPSF